MAGIPLSARRMYDVEVERKGGIGRYDIRLKSHGPRTSNTIIELKREEAGDKDSETIYADLTVSAERLRMKRCERSTLFGLSSGKL